MTYADFDGQRPRRDDSGMSKLTLLFFLLSGILPLTMPAVVRSAGDAGKTDVLAMTAIPDGNYFVNLQIRGEGPVRALNLECRNGALKCVNTDEPRLADWKGRSVLIGNGVFMVQLAGESERATQFWVFRADGSAVVREVPDRGEKQTAVPVKGSGLKKP